jgi:hypothetical protein
MSNSAYCLRYRMFPARGVPHLPTFPSWGPDDPTPRTPGARGMCRAPQVVDSGRQLIPLLMALTSSPLLVSPLNSQKNAPPRPWDLAQLIFPAMVDGVS